MSIWTRIIGSDKADAIYARIQSDLAKRAARKAARVRLGQIVEATANSSAIKQFAACRAASLIVKRGKA